MRLMSDMLDDCSQQMNGNDDWSDYDILTPTEKARALSGEARVIAFFYEERDFIKEEKEEDNG